MTAFPEPTDPAASRAEVFVRYLDYFRARVIEKVEALPEEELRRSRLVSGWTPIELVKHLTHVERRWLEWGFEGRDVDEPWGDTRDGRWFVAPDESVAEVLGALRSRGGYTTAVLRGHGLDETGQPGERWDGAPPAALERIAMHLVQEYARHLGQLDIAAELAGGNLGE